MMTFYAAAGSYQIRNEDGKDMPYIMRLGKLQPVSIPEFSIWSMLLWDVLTHDELRKKYFEKMEEVKLDPSGFEKALEIIRYSFSFRLASAEQLGSRLTRQTCHGRSGGTAARE